MTFFQKRIEGRAEPILDPDIPIIDAHMHLYWDAKKRYMFQEYADDTQAGHRIVGSVYIETQAFKRPYGPELLQPIGEIEFANGVAAMSASGAFGECRIGGAIVGYGELQQGERIGELLDLAMQTAPDRFRGIRQITIDNPDVPLRYEGRPPAGVLRRDGCIAALKELARRGLSFDSAITHDQLGELAEVADRASDTTIVLNHTGLGFAMGRDGAYRKEVFNHWREGMRELARRDNVVCKVGGLGMPFWGFGFEYRKDVVGYEELAAAWQPYVETAIEAFGTDRCLMESNFPPDGDSCGFVPLWNALKHSVRGLSGEDKTKLFHDNAARIYRIERH